MLDKKKWTLVVAVSLVLLSVILYCIHFLAFHDAHHIWIFLVGDLAFLPVEVLLVTLILHQLLENREKSMKIEKMNMVIGTFFSTMGTALLEMFSRNDPNLELLREKLVISDEWSGNDFAKIRNFLSRYSCSISHESVDLPELASFLGKKEDFMIRLLENPVLLEHESFTTLLRAVFHLNEELQSRTDLSHLPINDRMHLSGDICRAYGELIEQWATYMEYLKNHYPYLFSLAIRTNPFDKSASPVIP